MLGDADGTDSNGEKYGEEGEPLSSSQRKMEKGEGEHKGSLEPQAHTPCSIVENLLNFMSSYKKSNVRNNLILSTFLVFSKPACLFFPLFLLSFPPFPLLLFPPIFLCVCLNLILFILPHFKKHFVFAASPRVPPGADV